MLCHGEWVAVYEKEGGGSPHLLRAKDVGWRESGDSGGMDRHRQAEAAGSMGRAKVY